MPYDAAAQYQAMLAKLRAAQRLAKAARLHRAAWASRSCGCAVCHALNEYDTTPEPVLDYQPDQQPTRRT